MTEATDWDAYYIKPAAPAKITRRITSRKLRSTLEPILSGTNVTICECGGANSCFIDDLRSHFDIDRYHIVDSNVYGIELLAKKYPDASDVSWELSDILDLKLDEKGFDFVYSVGLIEHFDKLGTSKSIHAHFDLCRPRGFVLVTFPTPTFLYKCIRRAAEATDRWEFPDERPLHFAEVEHAIADAGGEVVHKSINWLIGLTQGYILARKCAD